MAILDDDQNAVRGLACFKMLASYDVQVIDQTYRTTDALIAAIENAEVLVLIRERTRIDQALLSRLPKLKLINQTGKISNHLDLAA